MLLRPSSPPLGHLWPGNSEPSLWHYACLLLAVECVDDLLNQAFLCDCDNLFFAEKFEYTAHRFHLTFLERPEPNSDVPLLRRTSDVFFV